MEGLILADTDVVIDFFNGISPTAQIVESLLEKDHLAVSAVSVFELYAGVVGKKRLEDIDIFLRHATILPLDEMVAKQAAKIYTGLKTRGKLIGNQDLLIAATAIIYDLSLLTRNKREFERVEGLELHPTDSGIP